MNSDTASKLIAINREFYERFGASFSATRQRLQPGVKRILDSLHGNESILDLGCGNGELARVLAKRGHRGSYLGLDFSLSLLREASSQPEGFSARFMEVDLTSLTLSNVIASDRRERSNLLHGGRLLRREERPPRNDKFDVIFCLAVLHHIPSVEMRLDILKTAQQLLARDGRFILSNWQFLNSEKLKARIQPWDVLRLRSERDRGEAHDVDAGDYLLDWRSGGEGLRYVHHFTADELSDLARQAGFRVSESFLSDGEGGRLGLYQVWEQDFDVTARYQAVSL